MPEFKYVEITESGKREIWAFNDFDVLEEDLKGYCGARFRRIRRKAVGEGIASRTEYWKNFSDSRGIVCNQKVALNLGSILQFQD